MISQVNVKSQRALAYRPDIDGLRAVAVVPVILYHAGSKTFSGGFVGVDVFFVISGFLITSLIVAGLESSTFRLAYFYQRRIRRIFPALFVMLAACAAIGWIVLLPNDYKSLGSSTFATAAFVSNIYFWLQSGYFSPEATTQPLLHTWSLAVEEQYYILFPIYLIILRAYFPRKLSAITLGFCFGSFGLCVYASYFHPSAAFYLLPTRAWELFLGATLAIRKSEYQRSITANVASLFGVALIAIAVVFYDSRTRFPGFPALLPTIGAALFICAGPGTLINRVVATKLPNLIGRISYPLYLWHWPAIFFGRYLKSSELSVSEYAVIIGASSVLAVSTWAFIEQPVRHSRYLNTSARIYTTAAVAIALTISFGVGAFISNGFPIRIAANQRAIILANEHVANQQLLPKECQRNFKMRFSDQTPVTYCAIGTREDSAQSNILFFGDSQIEQLYYALLDLSHDGFFGKKQVLFATYGGCIPIPGFNRIPHVVGEDPLDCNGFNKRVIEETLSDDKIDTIVIGGEWGRYFGRRSWTLPVAPDICRITTRETCLQFQSSDESISFAKEQMLIWFGKLIEKHKKLIFILPFPTYPVSIPGYINRQIVMHRPLDLKLLREQHVKEMEPISNMLSEVAEALRADLIDPANALCPESECEYQKNMISMYYNANHISVETAKEMEPILIEGFHRSKLQ
jgi:peptidoglycan/LPS O-acetylase OafA/YrhL